MEPSEILAAVTSVWAVAMAVSPGLQIRSMLRTGSSEDVSLAYFGVLTVGFMLWVAYGIVNDDYVVAGPNAIATLFGIATIVIALRLRRRDGAEAGMPESRA